MEDFQSFGYGFPINHYPELVCNSQRSLHFFGVEEDEDLFKVQLPRKHASYHHRENNKGRGEKHGQNTKKQSKMCYVSSRPPKAVDEDLYKIPPEFLYQMPKRKRMLGNFWSGCLGLSCIA